MDSLQGKYIGRMRKLTGSAIGRFQMIGDNDRILVGLSGGKDSSVAAALCVEALGKDRVIGVLMPKGEHRQKKPETAAKNTPLEERSFKSSAHRDSTSPTVISSATVTPRAVARPLGNFRER